MKPSAIAGLLLLVGVCAVTTAAPFTRLVPLPPPRIVSASEDYPDGNHQVAYLIDGDPRTEYSSASLGAATFVEFDFGRSVRLSRFRHLDRNDPATVAASAMLFLDEAGAEVGRVEIVHVNQRAGVTFHTLPEPVITRRVPWRVTRLGPQEYGTVGGAELVTIPRDFCEGRDRVTDDQGLPVASQRLRNGELVILARDVPPFPARRYRFDHGAPHVLGADRVGECELQNDDLRMVPDPVTGAISELHRSGLAANWVNPTSGHLLND